MYSLELFGPEKESLKRPNPCLEMVTTDLGLCRDQRRGSEVDITACARQTDICPARSPELA